MNPEPIISLILGYNVTGSPHSPTSWKMSDKPGAHSISQCCCQVSWPRLDTDGQYKSTKDSEL